MTEDIQEVLFTEEEIQARVAELGSEITKRYRGKEITVISILNGAIFFTADLLRKIKLNVRLNSIRVSSYLNSTTPIREPAIADGLHHNVEGKHVILIDDILDTAQTLSRVANLFKAQSPASLRSCVLLDKPARRKVVYQADFVGFKIPDQFVVGYGLDFAQKYRNLPYIGVLRAEITTAIPKA